LIVAAPCSGSGKTTVTLGLLAALRQSERAVQPFKTGPDYIDTGHHEAAAGRPSFNLDTWAMPAPAIKRLVADTTPDADVAIVEGVMGLFDGASDAGRAGSGSTADLAALLGWPVVLVLDVSGQTETAAALALG
jgi:cobyrinic acid a,c-diamide synthase